MPNLEEFLKRCFGAATGRMLRRCLFVFLMVGFLGYSPKMPEDIRSYYEGLVFIFLSLGMLALFLTVLLEADRPSSRKNAGPDEVSGDGTKSLSPPEVKADAGQLGRNRAKDWREFARNKEQD